MHRASHSSEIGARAVVLTLPSRPSPPHLEQGLPRYSYTLVPANILPSMVTSITTGRRPSGMGAAAAGGSGASANGRRWRSESLLPFSSSRPASGVGESGDSGGVGGGGGVGSGAGSQQQLHGDHAHNHLHRHTRHAALTARQKQQQQRQRPAGGRFRKESQDKVCVCGWFPSCLVPCLSMFGVLHRFVFMACLRSVSIQYSFFSIHLGFCFLPKAGRKMKLCSKYNVARDAVCMSRERKMRFCSRSYNIARDAVFSSVCIWYNTADPSFSTVPGRQ